MSRGMPCVIEKDRLPPINKGGRPRGSGRIIETIAKLGNGDSIWHRTAKEAKAFRASAYRAGIKLMIVKVEDTGLYAIFRKD